jgi:hypothetical protein
MMNRHTLDLQRLADLVARGAGNRRDDGQLRPGQRVQQGTLACVGLPGNDHLEPFAQQGALLRGVEHGGQLPGQPVEAATGIGLFQKIDLLFGEIQRRFDQHAQFDEPVAQVRDALGKGPGERAGCTAGRGFGAGVDQVGDGFRLGQIQFVVQEGALSEFTRLGQAQTWQRALARRLETAGQQQLQHHRTAMRLQLQHVFAGVAVRRRKVERETLVDGQAIPTEKGTVGGMPRHQRAAGERLDQRQQTAAGHAHDADRTPPGCSGDGNNGILVSSEHGAHSRRHRCGARKTPCRTSRTGRCGIRAEGSQPQVHSTPRAKTVAASLPAPNAALKACCNTPGSNPAKRMMHGECDSLKTPIASSVSRCGACRGRIPRCRKSSRRCGENPLHPQRFRPSCRLIIHCCAIASRLLTNQYKTRPAGKKMNITLNTSGMIHIILACIGSGGVGFSQVWNSVEAVIRAGRM